MKLPALILLLAASAFSEDLLKVKFASKDVPLTADPASKFWKQIPPVFATRSNLGVELPGNRTEIRVRWTPDSLYVLMSCPYTELYVNPNPSTTTETNLLWEHDVAEIFLGADFDNIHRYREYQVSPQGEWVDLDIDTKKPIPNAWKWDSQMKVKARIDEKAKIWYGEFQIPFKSVTDKAVKPGTKMRGNFYRFQGGPPERKMVAWSPTGRISNHTPEKFGILEFVK
ncbi:carbohydrate-binding family 9-like protein [Bryobacter aggregatus]|uniref:carbohydrate-binding family 9-like protein n=1 Tax=Bryobacter aggregatus TaxID=360054 RepID=UPI00138E3326|nr:carbohydrate-binding family 9-like protein [Bryobacter aggregatus]